MKAGFATRVNLVTQVVEVANLSCWLKKSRIGRETYKKLLACSASKGTSQHLNKVIRDSSCGYFDIFVGHFVTVLTVTLLESVDCI